LRREEISEGERGEIGRARETERGEIRMSEREER